MPGEIRDSKSVTKWLELCDKPGGALYSLFEGIYGQGGPIVEKAVQTCRIALQLFAEAFGKERQVIVARSTGRINLFGMHIDHRGGPVNPIAINELFLVASPRDDDIVRVRNVEATYPEETFSIGECLPRYKIDDWDSWCHDALEARRDDPAVTWTNYVRAPILYLQQLKTSSEGDFEPPLRGMDVVISGTVPRSAGLSSSSSIVVATADSCLRLNNIAMEPMDFIDLCGYGEWYVGTRGGAGDHAAIKFSQPNAISHISAFPLKVETLPFPPDYSIVLANSLVEANKREGARDIFNDRVASYIFGLMLVEKSFPELTNAVEHLRDLTPANLGIEESTVYTVLKSLPVAASRADLRQELSNRSEEIEHVFRSHKEPTDGYKIRQVCTYGITECIRSEMAAERLRMGDITGFGELLNISHDGDRVTVRKGEEWVPMRKCYSDEKFDRLLADLKSGDPERSEAARLWRQPGGYDVSVPELDELVDLSLAAPGVVGARLIGAGLGGSILAVVESRFANTLIESLSDYYYRPRNLTASAEVVVPVGGASLLTC